MPPDSRQDVGRERLMCRYQHARIGCQSITNMSEGSADVPPNVVFGEQLLQVIGVAPLGCQDQYVVQRCRIIGRY